MGLVREAKMTIHSKTVLGQVCEVTTVHRTETAWRAYGKALGRPINVNGRSEELALENWQWMAERMNDPG
jgi:imidazoleglycerol phosphate dehydratase HisB